MTDRFGIEMAVCLASKPTFAVRLASSTTTWCVVGRDANLEQAENQAVICQAHFGTQCVPHCRLVGVLANHFSVWRGQILYKRAGRWGRLPED